jgi:hypothetical protein
MNALTLRHAHTVPANLANVGENAATKFLDLTEIDTSHRSFSAATDATPLPNPCSIP